MLREHRLNTETFRLKRPQENPLWATSHITQLHKLQSWQVCVCEAATHVIINNPVELKDRGEHCRLFVYYVCVCVRLRA